MKIVDLDTFDYSMITRAATVAAPRGNHGGKRKSPPYVDLVTAFDIETTYLRDFDQSVMYVWQWAFGPDLVVMGRTWDEFQTFHAALQNVLQGRYLIVWVHNLSYEFQFLAGVLEFQTDDVFAVRSRKVLKASSGNLEFRCSYLHSNMGLSKYLQQMKVEHLKVKGFDYGKIRYPWTPLTEDEKEYCIADVVGLVEALQREMEMDHDTLWTIPPTSTGYVRRDAKHAMQPLRHSLSSIWPDYDLHLMLRDAFRGGNTHASRYMAGYILRRCRGFDRSSSYPDVIVNCKFPMSKFWHEGYMTWDRYNDLTRSGKAVVMRVAIKGLRLTDLSYPCPYLSRDKCHKAINTTCDNGRLLDADYVEITITDLDWLIIKNMYCTGLPDGSTAPLEAVAVIIDSWWARYGYLPKPLRDLTNEYYRSKTELKGKKDPTGEMDYEYYYNKSKALLNAIYGMMAQNPLRDLIRFNQAAENKTGGFEELPSTEADYVKKLKGMWESYAWGVWVTAWARYRLQEGIDLVVTTPGAEFVYCDTDSVKYALDYGIQQDPVPWSVYNAKRKADSQQTGACAKDAKGIMHYMGVYEYEADYKRFRTWGAKKYCYVDSTGIHVTVSGVNKRLGGLELARHGGIAAFRPGFVFWLAGGTELKYNDYVDEWIEVDGHQLHITRNVVIKESTYRMSVTTEYDNLIHYSEFDGLQMIL